MTKKICNNLEMLLAFLLITSTIQAQPYNFVRYDKNVVQQYKGREMNHFFQSLKELEGSTNRKVNIVHIGDSHIQADHFSGKLRTLFQNDTRFANGGRGFVFPYALAQSNNPYNYQVNYTGYWAGQKSVNRNSVSQWGLSAISAKTTDSRATVTINPNISGNAYKISRIKIFYPVFDETSFNVSLEIDPKELISTYSSRSGYVEYQFRTPQSSIKIILNKSGFLQNHFLLQGINLENDDAGVIYHAIGINGAVVPTYFRCQDFEKHLEVLNPDLVIISLGANDTHVGYFNEEEYKNNLRYLVYEVRKASPQTSILIISPADSYLWRRHVNLNNEKARQQILELSEEMNVAVWDFFEVMGGLKSIDKWVQNNLAARDKLHFTPKGYELQGDILFSAIDNAYKTYSGVK